MVSAIPTAYGAYITVSARLLFDKTFAQPDVFTVVNVPIGALSVFYSTVLMPCLEFFQS